MVLKKMKMSNREGVKTPMQQLLENVGLLSQISKEEKGMDVPSSVKFEVSCIVKLDENSVSAVWASEE